MSKIISSIDYSTSYRNLRNFGIESIQKKYQELLKHRGIPDDNGEILVHPIKKIRCRKQGSFVMIEGIEVFSDQITYHGFNDMLLETNGNLLDIDDACFVIVKILKQLEQEMEGSK